MVFSHSLGWAKPSSFFLRLEYSMQSNSNLSIEESCPIFHLLLSKLYNSYCTSVLLYYNSYSHIIQVGKHKEVGTSSLWINDITFMLFGYYTVSSFLFLALGKRAVLPNSQYRFLLTSHDWIYIPHPRLSRYKVCLWDSLPISSVIVSSDRSLHYLHQPVLPHTRLIDKSVLSYIPIPDVLQEERECQILSFSTLSAGKRFEPSCILNQ